MRKIEVLIILAAIPLPLFAYLDPGSGSMLFSAVIGIVATLFFVLKGFLFKIIDLPAYIAGAGRKRDKKRGIVFFSEGPQYWNVFKPVIDALVKNGVSCTYFSSKENDPGLNYESELVETKFIGEGNKAMFFMNTLEADLCIMTTPGLDVLQLKRSKGVKKYCHITHSSGGSSGYFVYGLDYYDIVLTGGDGDKEFIEAIESARPIKKKSIIPVGCTYLDVLRQKLEKSEDVEKCEKKTILVSPTWGTHGLLKKYGKDILKKIADSENFRTIIRPHPQSYISEKKMLDKLMGMFPQSENVIWDNNPDGLISMKKADIMISDFSGIVFDFIFLFQKPVITFKAQYDRKGKDSMDYEKEPWNIRTLDVVGRTCDEKDIPTIIDIVNELASSQIDPKLLNSLRNDMDCAPGQAGANCAQIIAETVKKMEEA